MLPGVAAALGVDTGATGVELPAARRVCVVLVDGLGHQLLEQEARQARRSWRRCSPDGRALTAGCPSTTATSLGSFGTGLPPGQHGLVGYEVMDPDRGVLLNELRWDPATDPVRWQPLSDRVRGAGGGRGPGHPDRQPGVRRIRPDHGRAARRRLRRRQAPARPGGRRRGRACRGPGPALVYLYWGDVDGAGHVHGWRSARVAARAAPHRPGAGPAGPRAAARHAAADHRRPRDGRRAAHRADGPGRRARSWPPGSQRARRGGAVRPAVLPTRMPPSRMSARSRTGWPTRSATGPGCAPGDRRSSRAGSARSRTGCRPGSAT